MSIIGSLSKLAKEYVGHVLTDGVSVLGTAANPIIVSASAATIASGSVGWAQFAAAVAGADETLSSASPAVSVAKRTSRFDLATRAGNIAATLADGTTAGQRKSLVNMSASNAHATTITPATMGESLTAVVLTAQWDACELEWQSGGWRVVRLSGTASVS